MSLDPSTLADSSVQTSEQPLVPPVLAQLRLSDADPCSRSAVGRSLEGVSRRGTVRQYELASPLAFGGTGSGLLQSRFLRDLQRADTRKVRHRLLSAHAEGISKYGIEPFFRDLTFGNLRPGRNTHLQGAHKARHYNFLLVHEHLPVALSTFDIELEVREAPSPALTLVLTWDLAYVLRDFRGKGAGRCLMQAMAKLLTHQVLHLTTQLPAVAQAQAPAMSVNVRSMWASQAGLVLHGRLMEELEQHRQASLRDHPKDFAFDWLPADDLGSDYI